MTDEQRFFFEANGYLVIPEALTGPELARVRPEGGATAVLPGSHRFPAEIALPRPEEPAAMPGHARMAYPAGTVWLFNGRLYHAALDNHSDTARRVLIYNCGHFWMKMWQGY